MLHGVNMKATENGTLAALSVKLTIERKKVTQIVRLPSLVFAIVIENKLLKQSSSYFAKYINPF